MNPLEENKSFKSSSVTDKLQDDDDDEGDYSVTIQLTNDNKAADEHVRDVGQVQRGGRREDVVEVFGSWFFEPMEGGA